LAVSSCICACTVTLRAWLFVNDGWPEALALYAFSIGIAYITGDIFQDNARWIRWLSQAKTARFAAFMLNIGNTSRFVRSAASWAMMIVPAAAALVIYSRQSVLRILFELTVVIIAYITALRHSERAPGQVLRDTSLYAGLFFLTVCLELPFLIDGLSHLRPWYFGVMYFLIFSYMIIKNQEDIDRNIYDKKHVEKSVLPRNMRRFNTTLVCIVFLSVLLLFNFRSVVIWLLDLARKILGAVISAFLWLIRQVTPDMGAPGEGLPEGSDGMFDAAMPPPSPLGGLIFNIFKYFIFFYLLYKLVFLAASKIPAIVSRIAGWLRKVFMIKGAEADNAESEYVDLTETVLPVREMAARSARPKKRRTYRHLRKISDPVQRVRYMYGLILDTLVTRGVRLTASDTAVEIADKASSSESLPEDFRDELRQFTAIYEHVRYGEKMPDKEMLSRAEAYCERTTI